MSAQGQRKKPPVFSSSAKNDFVTNYEPVVHFKTKKKKFFFFDSGNSERKLGKREWANEREQECMMKEYSVEINESERAKWCEISTWLLGSFQDILCVWSATMMPQNTAYISSSLSLGTEQLWNTFKQIIMKINHTKKQRRVIFMKWIFQYYRR